MSPFFFFTWGLGATQVAPGRSPSPARGGLSLQSAPQFSRLTTGSSLRPMAGWVARRLPPHALCASSWDNVAGSFLWESLFRVPRRLIIETTTGYQARHLWAPFLHLGPVYLTKIHAGLKVFLPSAFKATRLPKSDREHKQCNYAQVERTCKGAFTLGCR